MSLAPLKFQNGKFTVLYITDIQDLHYTRSAMFKMLDAAYDKLRPDLVVLAGDNILGNHICDSRIPHGPPVTDPAKELRSIKKAIDCLVAPIARRGLPFAVLFGNHDDSPHFSKEDMAEIYRSYPNCYGLNGEAATGDADSDCVSIFSSDGARVAYNLWLINSVRHLPDGSTEDFVSERTVAWYRETSKAFTAQNGGRPIPAIWMQHMPPVETERVFLPCEEFDRGAVKGPDGNWYRLHGKGIVNRYPRRCERSNGELEAIKECGDVHTMLVGHDHVNHFTAKLDGIRLISTPCASFRCSSNRLRGVRTFVLDEAGGGYETQFYSYQDLLGNGLRTELPFLIQADGLKRERITLLVGAIASACLVIGGSIAAGCLWNRERRK